MATKRIEYLDSLKAIAIFLVVFCHFVLLSPTVFANLCMCACWMAVPVFFMVNGALLFAKPLHVEKHLKKTVSVYLVLVIWKLVYLLAVPRFAGVEPAEISVGEVVEYLFLFGELPGIINGHLWFIEALLAVYLVFPLFRIAFAWEIGETKKREAKEEDGVKRNPAGICPHRLTWFLAFAALFGTNGLYSLEVAGSMLRRAGIPFPFSFDAVAAFWPFGKYGNMLGFFLLGALLAGRKKPYGGTVLLQRLAGLTMLVSSLFALWGVKWFLSGQAAWDGILLQEGYRHVPVVFMAVGLFLLLKNTRIRVRWLSLTVRALASRTLGIFYLHWLFGWMLVTPFAGWLASCGIPFGVGTNILKNLILMLPAFFATLLLEKIPVVKRLVTG